MKKTLLAMLFCVSAGPAVGQTCIGSCGTASPNGDVTAPPSGGPNYQFVSTAGGIVGAGQVAGVGGTNGSEFITPIFAAAAGDILNFNFNYVTSDGSSSFTDYTFAELLFGGVHSAWLFTARTTPSGDTSPGFGLPANDSTLTPLSSAIIPGAPEWAQLGVHSNTCWSAGCGYTGWINSLYTIDTAGNYSLRFGVTNVGDQDFDSGLAFAGLQLNDVPIDTGAVPEPATWAMMLIGFGAMGVSMRRRRRALNLLQAA